MLAGNIQGEVLHKSIDNFVKEAKTGARDLQPS